MRGKRRVRYIQQLEHSDCGQACIRMIADFYGCRISVSRLREISETSRLGMSAADIRNCFDRMGFDCAIVRLQRTQIANIPMPCILFWEQKHFVILYKIDGRNNYHIVDPSIGKRKISGEDFFKGFLSPLGFGIAIIMEPDGSIGEPLPPAKAESDGLPKLFKKSFGAHRRSFIGILIRRTADRTEKVLITE